MNHDIPLKYFDIADEYATECAEPVADAERTPLAHYFQLLLTRLMNNEEISEEAQHEMAAEAGINPVRIDEIAEFLNQSVSIVVRIKRSRRIWLTMTRTAACFNGFLTIVPLCSSLSCSVSYSYREITGTNVEQMATPSVQRPTTRPSLRPLNTNGNGKCH